MLTAAQQRRVEAYLPLVATLANKVHKRVPFFPRDELRSRGNYGLCRAAEKYNPDKGTAFATFAGIRIHGEMIEALRRADPRSRGQRQRGERKPQFQQPSERIPDPRSYAYDDQRENVRHLTRDLIGPWRTLIERYYVDGVMLKDVAVELGISANQAANWHREALKELREAARPSPH